MIPPYAKTDDWPRLVSNEVAKLERRIKALEARYSAFGDYADDTAAATAGVPVGGFYHTSGAVKVRVA